MQKHYLEFKKHYLHSAHEVVLFGDGTGQMRLERQALELQGLSDGKTFTNNDFVKKVL